MLSTRAETCTHSGSERCRSIRLFIGIDPFDRCPMLAGPTLQTDRQKATYSRLTPQIGLRPLWGAH
jgi:hypothetical protein